MPYPATLQGPASDPWLGWIMPWVVKTQETDRAILACMHSAADRHLCHQ
jgi:hypothetical protein